MNGYIIETCGTVLLVLFVYLILPDGKAAKAAAPALSLIITLSVALPVFSLLKKDGLSYSEEKEISFTDENFLNYVNEKKIDVYRENCNLFAENLGVFGAEFIIEYTVVKSEPKPCKVNAFLQNAVITSDTENIIIMQRLKKEIADYFSLNESDVMIYE